MSAPFLTRASANSQDHPNKESLRSHHSQRSEGTGLPHVLCVLGQSGQEAKPTRGEAGDASFRHTPPTDLITELTVGVTGS